MNQHIIRFPATIANLNAGRLEEKYAEFAHRRELNWVHCLKYVRKSFHKQPDGDDCEQGARHEAQRQGFGHL